VGGAVMDRAGTTWDTVRPIVDAVLAATDPKASLVRAMAAADLGDEPVVLIATGKASAPMIEAALPLLAGRVRTGVVTCVPSHAARVTRAVDAAGLADVVDVCPADHPLATARNIAAAETVAACADSATREDRVIALVSGGASAHLTLPHPDVGLASLVAITDAMLRAGASIGQLNAVRKHLELLKGGRLAARCAPARVDAFVLSDVLGDPIDVIGSGPFAADRSTLADAVAAIDHAEPCEALERARVLFQSARASETPKPGDTVFDRVSHTIIANNAAAVDAAVGACRAMGCRIAGVRTGVTGEAGDVARAMAQALRQAANAGHSVAIVWGGETTVRVGGAPGRGGRNTEAALAAAIAIDGDPRCSVVSLATDGVDGPTDAAGGFVDGDTCRMLRTKGVDPAEAMARHDSYTALDSIGGLIRTGPTGTNVNDVLIGIAQPAARG
jgi:hydroxypyruvate reductase